MNYDCLLFIIKLCGMLIFRKREGVIIMKNKKGFTLAEILLVVAIIAILSGVTLVGVSSLVNNSKATADKVKNNAENFELAAASQIKSAGGKVASNPVETETLNTKPTPSATAPSETEKPTNPSTPASEPSKDPSGSQPSGTSAPSSESRPTSGSSQGGSGSITVSGSSLTTAGSNVAGPISYSASGDTLTVKLNAGNSNASDVVDISIKKQADGTYLIDYSNIDGGKYWIVQNCGVDNGGDYWNGKMTRVMTAQEIQNALHLTLS